MIEFTKTDLRHTYTLVNSCAHFIIIRARLSRMRTFSCLHRYANCTRECYCGRCHVTRILLTRKSAKPPQNMSLSSLLVCVIPAVAVLLLNTAGAGASQDPTCVQDVRNEAFGSLSEAERSARCLAICTAEVRKYTLPL